MNPSAGIPDATWPINFKFSDDYPILMQGEPEPTAKDEQFRLGTSDSVAQSQGEFNSGALPYEFAAHEEVSVLVCVDD